MEILREAKEKLTIESFAFKSIYWWQDKDKLILFIGENKHIYRKIEDGD